MNSQKSLRYKTAITNYTIFDTKVQGIQRDSRAEGSKSNKNMDVICRTSLCKSTGAQKIKHNRYSGGCC